MRHVDNKLRATFSGEGCCARCGAWCWRQCHHCFVKKGMGGGRQIDVAENLIGLCALCHHYCEIDTETNLYCQVLIAAREGRLVSEIREWLHQVVAAPKEGPMPARPERTIAQPVIPVNEWVDFA